MASYHGTVSTILAVHSSAPCSPCMNWLRLQRRASMPNSTHSFSPHFSTGVPMYMVGSMPVPMAASSALMTASRSTSVSHGRSVVAFHWPTLAFS